MIVSFIQLVFLAAGLMLGLSCSSVNVVRFEGTSMLPAYKDGDRVVIRKERTDRTKH